MTHLTEKEREAVKQAARVAVSTGPSLLGCDTADIVDGHRDDDERVEGALLGALAGAEALAAMREDQLLDETTPEISNEDRKLISETPQLTSILYADHQAPGHTDLMVSPESIDKALQDNPTPVSQFEAGARAMREAVARWLRTERDCGGLAQDVRALPLPQEPRS